MSLGRTSRAVVSGSLTRCDELHHFATSTSPTGKHGPSDMCISNGVVRPGSEAPASPSSSLLGGLALLDVASGRRRGNVAQLCYRGIFHEGAFKHVLQVFPGCVEFGISQPRRSCIRSAVATGTGECFDTPLADDSDAEVEAI